MAAIDLAPWQERMREEHTALQYKLSALEAFIESDKFKELSAKQRALLQEQKHYMEGYASALRRRML